jgi:hypothetical protein
MKTISMAVVLLLFNGLVFAQKDITSKEQYKNLSVISPASASFEFSNGFISWTLGDAIINLKVGESDVLSTENLDFNIEAYPNPTSDKVNITHNSKTKENFTVTIYDFNGRTLIKKQLISQENEINMQYLPPALYEVKVTNSKNQMVKSFKIIKH